MKRIYTTLLILFTVLTVSAQKVNKTFQNTNLPEILKFIDKQMKGSHIHFIFDDLDGITVTRTFNNLTPMEAVRKAIGAYPIKITEDEGDIYVEYDKSIIKDVVLDNVTIYGNAEMMSTLKYMKRAMNFSIACPQEKVYLHFDNTGYFMGETIFFKAYVVNAATQMRTELSQTLYVELVNPEGEVVNTQKVFISDGEGDGSIKLENLYTSGFYEIRAYTRYMLNWDSSTLFSRVMPIFRQPKKEGDYSVMLIDRFSHLKRHPSYREMSSDIISKEKTKPGNEDNLLTLRILPIGKINCHFYPEGGHLVEDLSTRVAFTVNDSEGEYFDCSGTVVDADDNEITSVQTIREGRSVFDIKPTADPLFMRIKTRDGKTHRFQLPEVEYEGLSLSVNTLRDDYITARIAASRALHDHTMGYVLMNQGRIITCDTLTCRDGILLKFERKLVPPGVNQLTIFDDGGRIFAERLFFVCPPVNDDSKIQVSSSQKMVSACGKVRVNLHARPNSSISFSAMDAATLPNGSVGNAKTWMLLASDIKGYIANPDYYFESDDREHRLNADLLMMVQGWRRYDWSLMIGESQFSHLYPIEDHLYIDGKVLKSNGREPAEGIELKAYLYNRAGDVLSGITTTDSIGNYAFKTPDMGGEWKLIFNTNLFDKPIDTRVCVNRSFSPQARYLSPYETTKLPPLTPNLFNSIPDSVYDEMEQPLILKRSRVLPEVKVKAKKRIYDNARQAWESEKHGQYYATIYYDCDKELEKIYDRGDEVPVFLDWLYARNPLFEGLGAERYIQSETPSNIVRRNDPSITSDLSDNARIWNTETKFSENKWTISKGNGNFVYGTANKKTRFIDNGMSYKNRPIVWILNNAFYSVSYLNSVQFSLNPIRTSPIQDFPFTLDEVKSVYLSEDVAAHNNYVISSDLDAYNPVTVFVYTHYYLPAIHEGARLTHFNAYNTAETFHMDDYSVLPPMEDFRRTIFWEPNVRTDDNGNATVEFFNNSSCRRMYISAEGLDKTGNPISN